MTQAELLPALQFTPPVLSLNFEELEARITDITERYTGLVVGEDDLIPIKSEMAGLNKLTRQLADARKDAVAQVSGPIKEFEGKIKGLEAKVQDTRTFLDDQVKAHVQRERDCKRASVQFIIDYQKDDFGCSDLAIPIQENWLNKTAKEKQITAEVQAIILAHKKAEEEKAALEQAKQERIITIEAHCKAMEQTREYTLPFSRFAYLQSLDTPLAYALKDIEKAYAAEDEKLLKASIPKQLEPEVPAHFMDPPKPAEAIETPAPLRKAMTITATYSSENAAVIQKIYAQLKAVCDTCTVKIEEI